MIARKKARCPTTDVWIKKTCYIHTVDFICCKENQKYDIFRKINTFGNHVKQNKPDSKEGFLVVIQLTTKTNHHNWAT